MIRSLPGPLASLNKEKPARAGNPIERLGTAPVHRRRAGRWRIPPTLPAGAEPLAAFVRGPELLTRRLTQIGVVAGAAEGQALASQLVQGQRLVTRDGAMWRWDGFAVAAGAVTTAETRLRQRTRLDELQEELSFCAPP